MCIINRLFWDAFGRCFCFIRGSWAGIRTLAFYGSFLIAVRRRGRSSAVGMGLSSTQAVRMGVASWASVLVRTLQRRVRSAPGSPAVTSHRLAAVGCRAQSRVFCGRGQQPAGAGRGQSWCLKGYQARGWGHCEGVISAWVVAVGFELVAIGWGEVFYAVDLPRICRQRKLRSFQQAFGIQRMMRSVMSGNLMMRDTSNTKMRMVKMG